MKKRCRSGTSGVWSGEGVGGRGVMRSRRIGELLEVEGCCRRNHRRLKSWVKNFTVRSGTSLILLLGVDTVTFYLFGAL